MASPPSSQQRSDSAPSHPSPSPAHQTLRGPSDYAPSDYGPILCVGLVCLDVVHLCERYPREDEDMRASGREWQSGGNAGNTAKVLPLLGRPSHLLATLGVGMETE